MIHTLKNFPKHRRQIFHSPDDKIYSRVMVGNDLGMVFASGLRWKIFRAYYSEA